MLGHLANCDQLNYIFCEKFLQVLFPATDFMLSSENPSDSRILLILMWKPKDFVPQNK